MKRNENTIAGNGIPFWLCAGLLVLLLVSTLSRDITRPFYGIHSWAEAHSPWLARVQIRNGFSYTKGFMTWSVGNPPTVNPRRYLDHPQITNLINSAFAAVLGLNEWALRVENIIASVITLLLFLKILKNLMDEKTALLSGLLFCLFPVIGYFGVNMWLYPFTLWGIWNYLVIMKGLKENIQPTKQHRIFLAICLFMMLQISWEGFFFALGIGVHYIFRCIRRKQFPDKTILGILSISPLGSLALDFGIMAIGYGGFSKIIELFKWRAGSGEMAEHIWSDWFAKCWEFAETNFTLPILLAAIMYLTLGQLLILASQESKDNGEFARRRFPQFWLFFMPPVFQLLILKGCIWKHQTWERPFCFPIAIAGAMAIMLLGDILGKINKRIANAGMILLGVVFFTASVIGTNYYYNIRWQQPAKIEMIKLLNQKIPSDKALLSFEDFIIRQHPAKGDFYRPEIAWYLDREIVQATSFAKVQEYARTGRYPYYLVPAVDELSPLIAELQKHYKMFKYFPGDPGEQKYGRFYKAGMPPYMVFDLNAKATASQAG